MVNHALVIVGDAEVGVGNIRHVIVPVVIVLVVICVLRQEDLDRENVLSR